MRLEQHTETEKVNETAISEQRVFFVVHAVLRVANNATLLCSSLCLSVHHHQNLAAHFEQLSFEQFLPKKGMNRSPQYFQHCKMRHRPDILKRRLTGLTRRLDLPSGNLPLSLSPVWEQKRSKLGPQERATVDGVLPWIRPWDWDGHLTSGLDRRHGASGPESAVNSISVFGLPVNMTPPRFTMGP